MQVARAAGSADPSPLTNPYTPPAANATTVELSGTINKLDFGQVNAAEADSARRKFIVRNTTLSLVTIDSLKTSCGCTSTAVDTSGSLAKTPIGSIATLTPGEEISITAAIETARLMPGPFDKFVWINVRGSSKPAATIELTGVLQQLAAFTPSAVDFGTVRAGSGLSRTVGVVVDPAMLPNVDPSALRLGSTTSDFVVSLAHEDLPTAADKVEKLTFAVSVAGGATWGQIASSLTFLPTGNKLVDKALRTLTVPVSATVVGPVTATPLVVSFSTVNANHGGVHQSVDLTATVPGIIGQLKAVCGNEDVLVHVVPVHSDGMHAQLIVTLKPTAALGVIDSNITVSATLDGSVKSHASGAFPGKLVIPVYGYVVAKPAPL